MVFLSLAAGILATCASDNLLPNTQPLTGTTDLSVQMVSGISRYLDAATIQAANERPRFWSRDFKSSEAYNRSVQPNRDRLRQILGAADKRATVAQLEFDSGTLSPQRVCETDLFTVRAVRWAVLQGLHGEGLWLLPKRDPLARIIVLPDADQTPEMVTGLEPGLAPERQLARRLAENGCEVLVPTLVNRQDTCSGSQLIRRFTNQPHREWIYRQAFELGRHIIGYEVQKVLAAVDFFQQSVTQPGPAVTFTNLPPLKIGVAGYAEGGLIAFYAAALDDRIEAALVSGYFDVRNQISEEPIYRSLFGLLREFGDAEVATLIVPRALVIEYSPVPAIAGPPAPRPGCGGAAPGRLLTPDYQSVEIEFERARELLKPGKSRGFDRLTLISGTEGRSTGPGSDRALEALLRELGIRERLQPVAATAPTDLREAFDPAERQRCQVAELEDFTQRVFRECERSRAEFFWQKISGRTEQDFAAASVPFRERLWNETIGRLPDPTLPANPRTREVGETPQWTDYEWVLDVHTNVFAWGRLLLPRNLQPGEKRPVIVCQHGLEGLPQDVITTDSAASAHASYKGFAARLADRGFIVCAPHNPYRGGDRFRQLQRKANPLRLSLFSFIIAQHNQLLNWLATLPPVDASRIGFYGLSYGGKTAMRVPAVLPGYALSICSGDFNEWVRKNVSVDFPASYMFTGEYEMPEWDLGHTFNYAEMAALIAPRPFMVERGHDDAVGLDEWVAYEYARVRRLYDELGLGDRTQIEFFRGPHTINGRGTFDFLHRHLAWPRQD